MKLEMLANRADELLALGKKAAATNARQGQGQEAPFSIDVDVEIFAQFRAGSLDFLAATFGRDHSYYKEFDEKAARAYLSPTKHGIGIITAAKDAIAGGWLRTTKGILSAEIFSDFISMAEHLLQEGYKDPAAVIAGSTLEQHIRSLCVQHGIATEVQKDGKDVPRKADALNAELARADVISKLDQKNVMAWLDLRNKAAHGEYGEYSSDQVRLLIGSIVDFMARTG